VQQAAGWRADRLRVQEQGMCRSAADGWPARRQTAHASRAGLGCRTEPLRLRASRVPLRLLCPQVGHREKKCEGTLNRMAGEVCLAGGRPECVCGHLFSVCKAGVVQLAGLVGLMNEGGNREGEQSSS